MFKKIKETLAAPGLKRQEEINARYKELIDSMIIDRGMREHLFQDRYLNYNFTVFMGMCKSKPRIIDMNDTPNFFVVDREKKRKNEVIRTMVTSLAAKNYPEDFKIMIIDTTGEYEQFKDLPHIMHYAHDAETVVSMIDVLINELNKRHALLKHYSNVTVERLGLKRMLLVFDDLAAITQMGVDEAAVEKLADALMVAHKFGIHCILGSSYNITDVIEDDMLERYMVRVLFSAKDAEESKKVIHKAGAESISETEAAWVLRIPRRTGRDDDEPEENFRLKPYHISDEQVEHIVENWKKVGKK